MAPRNSRKVTDLPAWMKKFPKCVYPTLAPNLMEESLFLMLSRRTPGGFYMTAASSIYPEKKFASKVRYCTNDQTRDALKKVDRLLIKPFGPLLMRLPERKAEVALYQGFASALFAGRASWGWYNWSFHLGNILSKANIHYDVIYDEHILRGDLAKYEAVLLPHADLLTARVLNALQSFQKKRRDPAGGYDNLSRPASGRGNGDFYQPGKSDGGRKTTSYAADRESYP